MIGKKVILRGDRSGLFFGTLESMDGQVCRLSNARKLWYYSGAGAVEQISVDGVSNPENSKFTVWVKDMTITDMIQCLPCTEKAIDVIEKVKEWKA